uniref:Uncharacterized protein n=1 Tax=Arundo donax TaxID=35708 RepID=A0A0A9A417_ARUDO
MMMMGLRFSCRPANTTWTCFRFVSSLVASESACLHLYYFLCQALSTVNLSFVM